MWRFRFIRLLININNELFINKYLKPNPIKEEEKTRFSTLIENLKETKTALEHINNENYELKEIIENLKTLKKNKEDELETVKKSFKELSVKHENLKSRFEKILKILNI